MSVLIGNGDRTFVTTTNGTGTTPRAVAVGDINRDGKPDIMTANLGADRVSVLLGNGDGTFAAATRYPTGSHEVRSALGLAIDRTSRKKYDRRN